MKTAIFLLLTTAIIGLSARSPITNKHSAIAPEWWQTTIFYQIYPRSFKDSTNTGTGDIQGIISKLDHLVDAGVGATWLSPVFQSPMKDFGYDVSDFRTVDPLFGTMEDLDELFVEAKKRNIKIILDVVPNHTSDQHEWFQASSDPTHEKHELYKDYYIWKTQAEVDDNNWVSVFGRKAWSYNEARDLYYYHQFAPEQPDLNFRHEPVAEEMTSILKFWFDKGANGFRIDAINHMFEDKDLTNDTYIAGDPILYDSYSHENTRDLSETYEMVYSWRTFVDAYNEEHSDEDKRVIMTEAYTDLDKTFLFYGNADGTKIGAHFTFNFILIMSLNGTSTANEFKEYISEWIELIPEYGTPNWVNGNHDRARVGSRYGESLIDAMNILVQTLPGIAVTYYGEEIGMFDNCDISWEDTQDPQALQQGTAETYKSFSRDPVRTPFQWDDSFQGGFTESEVTWIPVHPNHINLNLAEQEKATKSHFKIYQKLANLRKKDAFVYGDFQIEVLSENVLVYFRTHEHEGSDEKYAIVINLGANEDTVDLTSVRDIGKNPVGHVEISSLESNYKDNEEIDPKSLTIASHDALVILLSSGNNVILSMGLIVFAILRYIIL